LSECTLFFARSAPFFLCLHAGFDRAFLEQQVLSSWRGTKFFFAATMTLQFSPIPRYLLYEHLYRGFENVNSFFFPLSCAADLRFKFFTSVFPPLANRRSAEIFNPFFLPRSRALLLLVAPSLLPLDHQSPSRRKNKPPFAMKKDEFSLPHVRRHLPSSAPTPFSLHGPPFPLLPC